MSLEDFASEIRALASRAVNGIEISIIERLIVKHFKDGFTNSNTMQYLIVESGTTHCSGRFRQTQRGQLVLLKGTRQGLESQLSFQTSPRSREINIRCKIKGNSSIRQLVSFKKFLSKVGTVPNRLGRVIQRTLVLSRKASSSSRNLSKQALGTTLWHTNLPINNTGRESPSSRASASCAEGLGTSQRPADRKVECIL